MTKTLRLQAYHMDLWEEMEKIQDRLLQIENLLRAIQRRHIQEDENKKQTSY